MTTTIQIDEETKKKLFQLKLKLEKEKGAPISYNELINFLLKNQYINTLKKENLKEFRKLKGLLPKSALNTYLKEKEKERIREEKRAQLPGKVGD